MPPRALDAAVRNVRSSGIARISLLLAILVFSSSEEGAALDRHQPISQLYHTSWGPKEGVNGYVSAIAQTTDGYLWVGTSEGLLRFDGMSFERFQAETGALPATVVNVLMAVPDGGLWVGFYRGGASFIRNGHVTSYSDADGFPVGTVRSFARDSSGAIWAATVGYLARFDGQRWKKIKRGYWNYPSGTAQRLLVDRAGTLWVTTGGQIVFLRNGERQFQDTGIQARQASSLAEAPDGAILFYDRELKKVRAFRHQEGKIALVSDVDIDIAAESMMFDRDGGLWLGEVGLSRILFPEKVRGFRFKEAAERFSAAQGLSNDAVESLFEDREGIVWVATDGGLDRFRPRNVKVFALRGGAFSLVEGGNGDIWAGSRDQTPLVRIQDGKPAVERISSVVTSYPDPDGTIWYAANNSLLHWTNGRFVKTTLPPEVLKLSLSATPPDPIIASAITKDRSGSLWVAFGGTGEFRLKDGKWNFMVILPDHSDWAANYAFTDNKDRIWLSFGDRIACYDHGNVQAFGSQEGLAVGPTNVIAGGDQNIWAGGESGLALFQIGRFHTIRATGDMGFTQVSGIVVARSAGIWLSTSAGIVHIPESETQNVIQHPDHKVAFELFDLVSDLPEPIQQHIGVYSPGAIQAHDGTIWFGTRNGAVQIDPNHIYRNPLPPPVEITSLAADHKAYALGSEIRLPPLTRDLEIDYIALSYLVPQKVRFRYKLEGHDPSWQEPQTRRQAFYNDLRPGHYRFRVIACNNDGIWNDSGATLDFSIAPAWFQTRWFFVLSVLSGLVLVWAFFRVRMWQMQKSLSARFNERLAERTRMARELHDTFLQTLQGSKLVADDALEKSSDPVHMRRAIEQLSAWLERAIHEGRAALNSLRTSTTQTNDLAEAFKRAAEESRMQSRMEVLFSVAGHSQEIHPVVRDEIYRIGYEAIRNAYTHSNGNRLEVSLRYGKDLAVCVSDNGVGIDPSVADQGKDGHFGLQGMRERATRIGGKLTIVSSPNSGTEVKIVVPGGIVFRRTRATLLDKLKNVFRRAGRAFHAD